MSAAFRVMVASDVVGDADLVRKLLRPDFENVAVSTDPARAVQDFEKFRPSVLVLAFDSLEKAERYYLGLYRLGEMVHALAHRTVILCSKDDLLRVYALCKKEYFDDYVLFWPMPHDAPRLPMAVHHALRQSRIGTADGPTAAEFAVQARRLVGMEATLERYTARGSAQIDTASRSVLDAQRDIGMALDGFSRELSDGDLRALVEAKDVQGLRREIDRLKSEAISPRLDTVAAAVRPVREWASALKAEMAPQVDSVRKLQALADRVRPMLLVVDDDEYQHTLLRHLLAEGDFELAFAGSGSEALASLRRCQPDLILMDVEMPDMNGVETTRRIKAMARFASTPILMITGHSDKDVVVESIKAGAAGFVVKPISKNTLLAKVQRCLRDAEGGADSAAPI